MFPFLSADPISVTCGGKMSRIEVYRTFLRIPPTICENGKNEKRKLQMIEKECHLKFRIEIEKLEEFVIVCQVSGTFIRTNVSQID